MFHDTYITSVSMGLINQLKHQLRGPQRRGQISLCEPSVCGDGVLDNGEDCDDGNNVSSDGCSACSVEPGCYCTMAI